MRPGVLFFRPFVNLSVGAYACLVIGGFCVENEDAFLVFYLSLLFIYELFVAMMHWFIVYEILKFRVDH